MFELHFLCQLVNGHFYQLFSSSYFRFCIIADQNLGLYMSYIETVQQYIQNQIKLQS